MWQFGDNQNWQTGDIGMGKRATDPPNGRAGVGRPYKMPTANLTHKPSN
ncbi:MAG: hypothetical protein FWG68_11090 [Defluviitaleaceae bacterium]|nr:hypothetical protein [Defluviitaleaceae bacterium]